ncbi:MAG: ATP-binding protein [Bacteroidales bacterium]|jgi:two-component system sensor histidine kinase/response regulator|nr:ATP-binding protein [Bacteroidales bacterium]
MLSTIIRNLVSNAIKYTPKGGEITISATSEINETKVSVMDTGIGIKPEDLKNLFKIDKATSTRGTDNEKGTGLGLLLCKDFVEKT